MYKVSGQRLYFDGKVLCSWYASMDVIIIGPISGIRLRYIPYNSQLLLSIGIFSFNIDHDVGYMVRVLDMLINKVIDEPACEYINHLVETMVRKREIISNKVYDYVECDMLDHTDMEGIFIDVLRDEGRYWLDFGSIRLEVSESLIRMLNSKADNVHLLITRSIKYQIGNILKSNIGIKSARN